MSSQHSSAQYAQKTAEEEKKDFLLASSAN